MSTTEAARAVAAVAAVARLLAPAGNRYVHAMLGITPGGAYVTTPRDLVLNLEFLTGAILTRFTTEQAAQIRDAAARALTLLPAHLDAGFFTALKAALNDANGDC